MQLGWPAVGVEERVRVCKGYVSTPPITWERVQDSVLNELLNLLPEHKVLFVGSCIFQTSLISSRSQFSVSGRHSGLAGVVTPPRDLQTTEM